jgi:para-nitrobenzyl esterase
MLGLRTGVAVAALLTLAPVGGWAQSAPTIGHAPALLLTAAPARGGATLSVTSPAFANGGDLPLDNTQYGANRFPGLAWTPGPAGTRSYVVVMQGVTGQGAATGTSVHLTLFNLAAEVTSLPVGLTAPPAGAVYGVNVHGANQPYAGPHTHGDAKQPYHLQVFALDTMLPKDPGLSFEALTEAMKGHVLASGAVMGLAAKPAQTAAPVRIDTGLLAGVAARDPSITVYKGVPYAAPPVGPLRFRAPAPPAAWAGVRQADRFGALCPQPQGGGPPPSGVMDEDCLTLNVWTGAASPGEKRPVLVWIYGGGFLNGTGANPEFDGEGLARKGVVVVTFNYRLGALGFLATPELSAESGHGASGNYGLLDDVAALKWVQRNIAAFGGDPSQVTIAGQSAGAGSVGFMTMSPLAKGLFQRSIAESHARYPRDPDLRFLSVSYRPLKTAEAAGAAYAAARGAKTPEELRAMPWQKLVEGSDAVDADVYTGTSGKPPLFRPVLDGWVIPRTYDAALKQHAYNDVVYVAGNNRDETGAVPPTAFATLRARTGPPRAGAPQVSVTLADYVQAARAKYGALADDFLRLYPATNDDEAALASNAAAQDNNRVSTYLWATEWKKGTTRPVYTYWWTHAPPGPGHDLRGAYHGSEINYVFGNLYATDRPWTDDDRSIADRMSSYWANIIKRGDPNGEGLPTWPAFEASAGAVMRLGDEWKPVPVAGGPEKIDFWRRFYATQDAW